MADGTGKEISPPAERKRNPFFGEFFKQLLDPSVSVNDRITEFFAAALGKAISKMYESMGEWFCLPRLERRRTGRVQWSTTLFHRLEHSRNHLDVNRAFGVCMGTGRRSVVSYVDACAWCEPGFGRGCSDGVEGLWFSSKCPERDRRARIDLYTSTGTGIDKI